MLYVYFFKSLWELLVFSIILCIQLNKSRYIVLADIQNFVQMFGDKI